MLGDLLINTNGYVLNLLKKILNTQIEIIGEENIPLDNPKMFVANHFTRLEAMVIPYSLYNITNKKVGVIADDSLFHTLFGTFLTNLGAMKKSAPNRNEHIIGDLITSSKDWMIFPEGIMVKEKDITRIDKNFCVKIDGACQRVYTGASVFALTSQILREKVLKDEIEDESTFLKEYFINNYEDISKHETYIVPINITYSRLRNGNNFLADFATKLIENIGNNFKEELEIESNIVLNSKITIRILEPISTKEILKKFDKNETQEKITNQLRYNVTYDFMNKIYESLTINFDHIFAFILSSYPKNQIELEHLKRLIYITIFKIKEKNLFYDKNIDSDLIYLVSYEKYQPFEDILQVAIKDNIITLDEVNQNIAYINKDILFDNHTHHTIRIKNILKVILNEIFIQEDTLNIVKNIIYLEEDEINKKLLEILKYEEENDYETSYEKYKHLSDIKPKEIGKQKYFENKNSSKCVIAIHGFSSSPKEMEELGLYLHKNDFNVILPRLDGHGTVPQDLKNKSWQDWYKAISRSITIATLMYKEVYIVGFSTGGLLTLLSSKKHYKEFISMVCINTPLNLSDIRMKTLLPAVTLWNDLVKAFNEGAYSKEFVDNHPENTHINYNKYYISAIEQLNLLITKTKENLHKIKKPILIIQAKDDPVVHKTSANEIFENIPSRYKSLQLIEANNHVIVLGKNSEEVFKSVLDFIKNE